MSITFEPLIAILIATQLRKKIKAEGTRPDLAQYMLYAMYAAVALLCLGFTFHKTTLILWLDHLLIFGLVALPYAIDEFKSSRNLSNAIIPYAIASFISDVFEKLFPKVFESTEDFFQSAVAFAFLWACAMWFINRKQNKALEVERTKRRNEEEQNRMMAAMKVNLESQVKERTAELTHQKEELQGALAELKSTQAQLVQQEKMASLGELTAGIAHEIQNPLNFVNNFSEVSIELLEELKDEILSKLPDDVKQEADDIMSDITQNLTKINQHGKRADAIVKGMLQHSRTTTGKKEPTDVNALADEYLRLSYHGLRAKDKMFNAGMKTSFDENLGKIEAIPQDLGRVLLNLFNNSFYSVAEKKKQNIAGYEPTVSVVTKKVKNAAGLSAVEITVSDNGTGIPQKVLDKIYRAGNRVRPINEL
jgi:two-component system NtrC family sensor kinase